jgi:hypothetical protein
MKPLTIDELRNLEVGDWVWIVVLDKEELTLDTQSYYRILEPQAAYQKKFLMFSHDNIKRDGLDFDTYGTKWLAYKNKEQAESEITNGSILRMLSNAELADFLCSEDFQRLKMSYSSSVLGIRDWLNTELTEEEAERRLAELKGEQI